MKNNKYEDHRAFWGSISAQMEAKGSYFLRLENPYLGKKNNPTFSNHSSKYSTELSPPYFTPRAKIRLLVSI